MNFDDVMERVATVLERKTGKKVYDKEIAEALGMKAPNYTNAKNRNSVPIAKVAEFCAVNLVSINWVLYEQDTNMFDDNTDDIFKIAFFSNINGGGGGEAINNDDDEIEYLTLDRRSAERIGISNLKDVEAINLTGDSMEPTLKDGSIIVIDRTQIDITGGGIFAVNTPSGLSIKRVSLNPTGGLILISENKLYPDSHITEDEATILGKVVGSMEKL